MSLKLSPGPQIAPCVICYTATLGWTSR